MLSSTKKSSFKSMCMVLSFLMVFVPTICYADPPPDSDSTVLDNGRVTSLNIGDPAPFSGILLDSTAAAKSIVDRRYSELRYELKLDLEIKRLSADYELKLGNLQFRYDGLDNRHTNILQIKDTEIDRLQEIIKDRPNDYSQWWAAGGFIVGAVLSVAIFFAASEASK